MMREDESPKPIKPVRLVVRLKNNGLLCLRERAELSQVALARRTKVPFAHVSLLENFGHLGTRSRPRASLDGDGIRRTISRLAKFFDTSEEAIAPRDLFAAIKMVHAERELDHDEVGLITSSFEELVALPAPDEPLDETVGHMEAKHALGEILDYLSPRENALLRLRFGMDDEEPLTFDQLGKRFHVTDGRAAQLVTRALRKLAARMTTGVGSPEVALQDFLVGDRSWEQVVVRDVVVGDGETLRDGIPHLTVTQGSGRSAHVPAGMIQEDRYSGCMTVPEWAALRFGLKFLG